MPEGEGAEFQDAFSTNTSLAGPAIEHVSLDEQTIEDFFNIASYETVQIGDAIEQFEASADELIVHIHRRFDTTQTVKKSQEIISDINDTATLHLLNYLKVYEAMSQQAIDDEEIATVLTRLYLTDLEKRNHACMSFYNGCIEGCETISFSGEDIKAVILDSLAEIPEDEQEAYGNLTQEQIRFQSLSDEFGNVLKLELSRILEHLPEENSYRRFDLRESLPGIMADIGKIAVGTAIGTTLALLIANKKKKS